MSIAPPGGQDRIMTTVPKATAPTSSSFAWQTASRWRSACRLERPAYSSISRRACFTGWSCRTFREKKNSDAAAVKREAEEE